ncbi:GNAT family N-acetyltransferase [Oxalicibacterium solurbis]|uniref:GCN5 family N-acetyltransferase n=1 Tax=Oxalicibacterium solurbis TaxID=69280 RepID=A0A8J3B298_9BURK|nr:GNAT family N-acetyltransferase [Oxalicibacterium solurbis]GGI53550.1 GCN5 family N-acetyltransferase [Oxalicibacterium solurbis]
MSIREVSATEFPILIDLWEVSVKATHHFLPAAYIDELRPRLLNEWLPAVTLRAYVDVQNVIRGFIGTYDGKIEMLFIDPAMRSKGIGKALVAHAIAELQCSLVDVNEQNSQAVDFYRHVGFIVIDRSPLDGQGKPYPILHMKLDASAADK